MNTHVEKSKKNKNQSVANEMSQKHSSDESTFKYFDNRPEAIAQRKLQEVANNYSSQRLQTIKKRENTDTLSIVQRVVYNSLTDVKNSKFLPTSSQYSDDQKLEIANWCANSNGNSNAIKSAYQNEFGFVYSTITGNDKELSLIHI